MVEEIKDKRWARYIYPWASMINSGDTMNVPENRRSTGRQLVFARNRLEGSKVYKYDSGNGVVVKL